MCICWLPRAGSSLWSAAETRGRLEDTYTECFISPRPPDMESVLLPVPYIIRKELKAFRTPDKNTLHQKIRSKERRLSGEGNGMSGGQATSGFLLSKHRSQYAGCCTG